MSIWKTRPRMTPTTSPATAIIVLLLPLQCAMFTVDKVRFRFSVIQPHRVTRGQVYPCVLGDGTADAEIRVQELQVAGPRCFGEGSSEQVGFTDGDDAIRARDRLQVDEARLAGAADRGAESEAAVVDGDRFCPGRPQRVDDELDIEI